MARNGPLSRAAVVIGTVVLLVLGTAFAILIWGGKEKGPPPPFSAMNDLLAKDNAPGQPDPLIAKFSSSERKDGLKYDTDKGCISIVDGSGKNKKVDSDSVSKLLHDFNFAVNVKDAQIDLLPNVHHFRGTGDDPIPLDPSEVTVSWEFFITSNSAQPLKGSRTFKDLILPPK